MLVRRPVFRPNLLTVAYFLAIAGLSIWRAWLMIPGAFDLGFLMGGLGAVLREGPGAEVPWAGWSLMDDHSSPILLLLSPLAHWRYGALALILIQAAAVTWAVWITYSRCHQHVADRWARWLIPTAVALHPAVLYGVLYDVHAGVIALPIAALFTFGIVEQRRTIVLGAGLALTLFREDLAVVAVMTSLINLGRVSRRVALVVATTGIAIVAAFLVRSGSGSPGTFSLFGYVDIGDPLNTLVRAFSYLTEGGWVIAVIIVLLTPWIFIAVPAWRLAVPPILVVAPLMFAASPVGRSLAFHYYAFIPVALAAATVDRLRIGQSIGHRRRVVATGLTAAWAIAGPLGLSMLAREYTQNSIPQIIEAQRANGEVARSLRAAIPCVAETGPLSVDGRVLPYLGNRHDVRLLPHPFEKLTFSTGLGVIPILDPEPSLRPVALITQLPPASVASTYVRDAVVDVVWWRKDAVGSCR